MFTASIISMRSDGRFFQAVPCINENPGGQCFEGWLLEMCIQNIKAAAGLMGGNLEKTGIIYYAATAPGFTCVGNIDARTALSSRYREAAVASIRANRK